MIRIRVAKRSDWNRIREIYIDGIRTNNATFETVDQVPNEDEWFNSKVPGSIFVAEKDHHVVGWVILSSVSTRCVYAGVAEVSVYIDTTVAGQGIGQKLLERIIQFADEHNIWTIESNMFSTNIASQKLHEKVGFKVLGIREKLGKINGRWQDILMMERRSDVIL